MEKREEKVALHGVGEPEKYTSARELRSASAGRSQQRALRCDDAHGTLPLWFPPETQSSSLIMAEDMRQIPEEGHSARCLSLQNCQGHPKQGKSEKVIVKRHLGTK